MLHPSREQKLMKRGKALQLALETAALVAAKDEAERRIIARAKRVSNELQFVQCELLGDVLSLSATAFREALGRRLCQGRARDFDALQVTLADIRGRRCRML